MVQQALLLTRSLATCAETGSVWVVGCAIESLTAPVFLPHQLHNGSHKFRRTEGGWRHYFYCRGDANGVGQLE